MATSTQRAVSDGTLSTLDISIDYLDRTEITVYFNLVPTTAWTWVGTTEKRIHFNTLVPNGVEVLIKRTTDITKLRHAFSLGAAFTAATLDEDLEQVLHIAQESNEGGLGGDFFNDIDMHGHAIKNGVPASDNAGFATLGQVLSVTASQVAAAQTAANAAASTYDDFDDRYLGPKATAPTLDNDGNALQVGAMFFHTGFSAMYVRSASNTWVGASSSASIIPFTPTASISSTNVQDAIVEVATEAVTLSAVLEAIYPVGSLYFNGGVSTNPSTLLGFGTWVAHAAGKAIVGVNPSNTLMDTVGKLFGQADATSVAHTHGVTDPTHSHSYPLGTGYYNGAQGGDIPTNTSGGRIFTDLSTAAAATGISINSSGISAVDKNYQPSIAVFIWRRTA